MEHPYPPGTKVVIVQGNNQYNNGDEYTIKDCGPVQSAPWNPVHAKFLYHFEGKSFGCFDFRIKVIDEEPVEPMVLVDPTTGVV